MWWGYGWWWWWGILIIFFLLPLGYGWGLRGWGPWYRRRPIRRNVVRPGEPDPFETGTDSGWGWLAVFLWIVLILEIIWIITMWFWAGR